MHRRALEAERLTLEELRSALRKQGIQRISDAARVVLEPDGTLTSVPKGVKTKSPPSWRCRTSRRKRAHSPRVC